LLANNKLLRGDMRFRRDICAALIAGLAVPGALCQTPASGASAQPAACSRSRYATDAFNPSPAFPGQTNAPAAAASKFKTEVVTSGLNHPWSLAFLPDGRILVTEKSGGMRIIDKGKAGPPLKGAPAVKRASLSGMHDVLLDPDFSANRIIYFNYVTLKPGETQESRDAPSIGRTARARISADWSALEDLKVIHEGEGAARRLVLARDGALFITSGIAGGPQPQMLTSDAGKVLRINRDGSMPKDNPHFADKAALPGLYTFGHRDPEGAALNPATGDLWTIEHGPRGGDELNIIRPGANYGYSDISYGRQYSGEPINGGLTARDGMEQPVYFWAPSIAPSGLAFYTGNLFPEWNGDIFVGAMAAKHLVRLDMKDGKVVGEERMLMDRCVRFRDVRQGPDGALWVLTDEDNGELLRLTPAR
jgi:aldose sugar dehydrogenase